MYTSKVKVFFYDADPAGIIFFSNIFRFAHSVYEEFMRTLNTEKNFFIDRDFLLPIIHAEADYLKSIKPGDELKVELIVTQLKKSSFELSYNMYNTNSELAAKVKTVHVCRGKKEFKKIDMPEDLYKKLSANMQQV
ncbi:acyl-CoA thioesterase [Melioribacteraceae bacterium 4301-Me]|uniref:acyl-CoA thioesterase n=1 Tax=Pyranulibacter aquaticus TaxID=3163344 RepID=UPI003594BB0E